MKTILATILVLATITMSAQVWESEDQTSKAACYEYDNRLEIYREYGLWGWEKDSLVWRKEVKGCSVVATKTTDGKWSVVVIERKEAGHVH